MHLGLILARTLVHHSLEGRVESRNGVEARQSCHFLHFHTGVLGNQIGRILYPVGIHESPEIHLGVTLYSPGDSRLTGEHFS